MPLDGICMQAVAEELRSELLGLRIDKVQQPARDQVILLLRGNKRLLLNAGANTPRIQLTALTRDNPAEPPMFCMLLRKHLVGGRVAAVTQPPLERLVRLELDVTDDFGAAVDFNPTVLAAGGPVGLKSTAATLRACAWPRCCGPSWAFRAAAWSASWRRAT